MVCFSGCKADVLSISPSLEQTDQNILFNLLDNAEKQIFLKKLVFKNIETIYDKKSDMLSFPKILIFLLRTTFSNVFDRATDRVTKNFSSLLNY